MFKELFSWWQEDVLLKEAFNNTKLSLEKVLQMFSRAMQVVMGKIEDEGWIYKMDQEINELEIDTRRKVLEHLSLRPAQDVTSSLIFATIFVDIERLGDYAKNIAELLPLTSPGAPLDKYLTSIQYIGQKLEELFKETISAVISADAEKARKSSSEYTEINRKCDASVRLLMESKDCDAKKIVCYTLLFRYLKRISSHLRNISTSVINPFERIGYKPI